MPLQRVVERDALTESGARGDRPTAADRARGPSSCAAGNASKPSRSAALATAMASMLSDFPRSRTLRRDAAISLVVTRTTRSPRPIRNRSNDPETCRQSSNAQTRSPPRARAQLSNAREAPARRPGPSARQPARRSPQRPRRSCASACGRPPRARSSPSSTSTSTGWTPGGHGLLRAMPRSIKSRRTSPTGDERHSERWSGPNGADSLKESQLAAGPRPSPRHRTSPTPQITTASVKAGAPSRSPSVGGCRGDTGAPVGSPTRRQTTAARYAGGEHGRTGAPQELRPRRSRRSRTAAQRWHPAGQRRSSSGWRGTRPSDGACGV